MRGGDLDASALGLFLFRFFRRPRFFAAEAGDGKKALVATWASGDIENVATNARETAYVGAAAAAETVKSFTIAAAWR